MLSLMPPVARHTLSMDSHCKIDDFLQLMYGVFMCQVNRPIERQLTDGCPVEGAPQN